MPFGGKIDEVVEKKTLQVQHYYISVHLIKPVHLAPQMFPSGKSTGELPLNERLNFRFAQRIEVDFFSNGPNMLVTSVRRNFLLEFSSSNIFISPHLSVKKR